MKLQMGDIETQAVCYENGTVAHRRPAISHQPQFSFEQLKEIVRRWNAFEEGGLVEELKGTLEKIADQAKRAALVQDRSVGIIKQVCGGIFSQAEAALAKS